MRYEIERSRTPYQTFSAHRDLELATSPAWPDILEAVATTAHDLGFEVLAANAVVDPEDPGRVTLLEASRTEAVLLRAARSGSLQVTDLVGRLPVEIEDADPTIKDIADLVLGSLETSDSDTSVTAPVLGIGVLETRLLTNAVVFLGGNQLSDDREKAHAGLEELTGIEVYRRELMPFICASITPEDEGDVAILEDALHNVGQEFRGRELTVGEIVVTLFERD